MARADLLLQLVEAALNSDDARVRSIVESLSAEEQAKKHTVLANDLNNLLDHVRRKPSPSPSALREGLTEVLPKRRLSELVLPITVREEIELLIEEQHRADVLRTYNLEPRNRVLLVGPPGNGKTTCAEAIASELSVPLIPLSYESIITSYFGETSARLGRFIEQVRRMHCVLLVDEFDTLAKERGDKDDSGEIKRVVSTLLLQLDSLPSHVILCAATNHSELLDRAVWRRFQLRLTLPAPSRDQRVEFAQSVIDRLALRLGRTPRTVIDKIGPASYAEIEEFFIELKRRQLLRYDLGSDIDSSQEVDKLIRSWKSRATGIDEVIQ